MWATLGARAGGSFETSLGNLVRDYIISEQAVEIYKLPSPMSLSDVHTLISPIQLLYPQ